jgi:hypothetical protein
MAAGPQRPSGAATNFDYWLGRCQGFRVDSHGRVGVVEEVRYASRCDRPDVIVVRPGRLRGVLLIVPVEEVAEIFPGRELVVLHTSPRPTATERFQGLPDRVQSGGRRRTRRPKTLKPEPCASKAQQEVEAVITRLLRRVDLRLRKGGEKEVTPDVDESAESSVEEPSAREPVVQEPSGEEPSGEEQAGEEPAAEAESAEAAAEAAPAEAASEEAPAEEQSTA